MYSILHVVCHATGNESGLEVFQSSLERVIQLQEQTELMEGREGFFMYWINERFGLGKGWKACCERGRAIGS